MAEVSGDGPESSDGHKELEDSATEEVQEPDISLESILIKYLYIVVVL